MKTLILIPCMDTVHTLFFQSMMALRRRAETEVAVSSSSLVYDARNQLAEKAVNGGYDRVLWLDSDMQFQPDLLERFSADLDAGMEMVCGLYFARRAPVHPCVYQSCAITDGVPCAVPFAEIPDTPFEIEACGFGGVMMTVDLLRRVGSAYGYPFSPAHGFGEDFSFCLRTRQLGAKIHCDPAITLDHVGYAIFNRTTWLATKEA